MQELRENKMGVMSEGKLLLNMALPMILSMLVQALYNIVDSVFVGLFDPEFNYAIAAVNLSFPIQSLMIAVGAGTGVGVNSLLSRSLGEKNPKEANLCASVGIFLYMISWAVFAVIGYAIAPIFFRFQTSVPEVIEYGVAYVRIVTVGSFGLYCQFIMERLLQATGRTVYSMYTQGLGAIINIIFDPLLIFGIGPFPRMGVAGAAIATVFGQMVGGALGIWFNVRKNPDIRIEPRAIRPDCRMTAKIYSVGLPSIVMQSITSVLTVGINRIVAMDPLCATAAQNVFGAYFKLQSFIFMPIFGLTNAMIPIIAYNYGARKKKRIYKTFALSAAASILYMLAGMLVFCAIPGRLLSLFSLSGDAITIGIPALRIMSTAFLFAGFNIVTVSAFQALGNGIYSMINSLCRQLAVILPAAYLLFTAIGINAMWWAFPIAEIVSLLLCAVFIGRVYRTKLAVL